MAFCSNCEGTGNSPGYNVLTAFVAHLIHAGVAGKRNYPLDPALPALIGYRRMPPDLYELTTALTGREPTDIGHDAIDRHAATRKIVEAAKLPRSWEICTTCKGSGEAPRRQRRLEGTRR